MDYPQINNLEVTEKRVLLRADLDVDVIEGKVVDTSRLENLLPSISTLLDRGAKQIVIIGHRGRPNGVFDENFSLQPVVTFFSERITPDIHFVNYKAWDEIRSEVPGTGVKLVVVENLRFWPGEEENSEEFAKELSQLGEVFVNDAFGSSHRSHASIVGVPKHLKSGIGLRFIEEIEHLGKVLENPQKPVLGIISGAKEDKVAFVEGFKNFCDKVLVAGKLPLFLDEDLSDPKIIVARLIPDKEDITIHSIETFEHEISLAGTIILAGPLSKYEDPGHVLGTQRVLTAISKASGYKVAGGGDTAAAIRFLHLDEGFDWISSGGGASLEFLVNKTLPGLAALIH